MITREKFAERVGREPDQDELDRCNCPKGDRLGHYFCGWDEETDLPVFIATPHKKSVELYPCDTTVMAKLRHERRPRNMNEPPFYTMITSGEFWRCPHGATRFDEDGCKDCDAEWSE